MMKRFFLKVAVGLLGVCLAGPVMAQFNLKKALSGAQKVAQAVTLNDEQLAAYVKEYVAWMDSTNMVCGEDSPYTKRLRKLTEGLGDAEGVALNFKVYNVKEVNAFACADGSVRVFSALKDGIAMTGDKAARLTDSQLGELSEALVNARYSRKQEQEADDYGYEFLQKAGKNPWAMAMSFRKLKELEEANGASGMNFLNQLFSTHPDLDTRIKRMEERARKEGITRPANF